MINRHKFLWGPVEVGLLSELISLTLYVKMN